MIFYKPTYLISFSRIEIAVVVLMASAKIIIHNISGVVRIKFNNLLSLKTCQMFEEYEKKKRKQVSLMRSVLDYGMGLIIVCIGIFFFFRDKFNLPLNTSYPPDYVDKILGGIFIVYGLWRTYRGYKKNYFKE